MKRFVVVTVAGTVLAALVGPRGPLGGFWAPAPAAPHVHGALLAGFASENMVENVAFGLGLAVLLLGRHWFADHTASTTRATTAWLATVWLFASWMPHAALHLHVGMQPTALLPIEWVFHGGAIVATGLLLIALSGSLAQKNATNRQPSNTRRDEPRDTRCRHPEQPGGRRYRRSWLGDADTRSGA
jgi:hypothetical protein